MNFSTCVFYFNLKKKKTKTNILNVAAAAAAKSLQSCPTLCDPIDGSPPGSSVPRILQARILEWVAISFSNACMHAKSLQSCRTLCNPMDSSPQAPLSTGFSKQEYWIGLPFPSPVFWRPTALALYFKRELLV